MGTTTVVLGGIHHRIPYFFELLLAVLRLGTEQGDGCLTFTGLLAAHAGPLHLPDLAARDLDVAGAAANARKGRDGLRDATRVLQDVDHRRYLAVVGRVVLDVIWVGGVGVGRMAACFFLCVSVGDGGRLKRAETRWNGS